MNRDIRVRYGDFDMLKKIMFFIPSLEYGGAERVTTYLTKYFAEKEYDVMLVTTSKKCVNEYVLHPFVKREKYNKVSDINGYIDTFLPDLIVIMFAPMCLSIVPIIRKYKIPYIISERNDPRNFAGKTVTRILYQSMMCSATGLVFQTKDAQDYYKRYRGEKKIIYNPLILENFPPIHDGKRKKVIVNVGRLHYQKNQKVLICAFSKLRKNYQEYQLDIYGTGELELELKAFIHELNLEDCVFLKGNKNNVLELENDNMMFVLSSDFEGMPNALIEAMALGLPVISTDCPCGGPRELIDDHVNGTLVPVNDVDALYKAMEELIINEELRNKYSKEAIKIREKLDEKVVLKEWEDFCNRIANMEYKR